MLFKILNAIYNANKNICNLRSKKKIINKQINIKKKDYLIWNVIHSKNCLTLVYKARPSHGLLPSDAIPIKNHRFELSVDLTKRGPPESPVQVSFITDDPVPYVPAHN